MLFSRLAQIRTQLLGQAGLMEEKEGARRMQAIQKAYQEICQNPTVRFENGILRFTSRFSGKKRFVTAWGCHNSCDCKGMESYHAEMFNLLSAYIVEELPSDKPKGITFDLSNSGEVRKVETRRGRQVETVRINGVRI